MAFMIEKELIKSEMKKKKIIYIIIIVVIILIILFLYSIRWRISKEYCSYNGAHDNGNVITLVGRGKCENCHKNIILPSVSVPQVLCEDCGKNLSRCTQCGKLLIK